MKILACVKQVPDIDQIGVSTDAHPDSPVRLDAFTDFRMNRFDEFVVEAAVRIKEATPEAAAVHIDVLTVGPERCQEVVRRALGMGADDGIHLLTGAEGALKAENVAPATIAAGISRYAAPKDYDLVLCGTLSEDGMNGQVGPMVAGYLGLPCATQVVHLTVGPEDAAVTLEREIEGGDRERLRLALPAVVAVQPGINTPRYPALSKLLRANTRELKTLPLETPGKASPRVRFKGMVLPRRTRAGRVLEGSAEEKASALTTVLEERALLA